MHWMAAVARWDPCCRIARTPLRAGWIRQVRWRRWLFSSSLRRRHRRRPTQRLSVSPLVDRMLSLWMLCGRDADTGRSVGRSGSRGNLGRGHDVATDDWPDGARCCGFRALEGPSLQGRHTRSSESKECCGARDWGWQERDPGYLYAVSVVLGCGRQHTHNKCIPHTGHCTLSLV